MTSNKELITGYRAMLDVNLYDYAYRRAVRASYADRLADALEAADAKLADAWDEGKAAGYNEQQKQMVWAHRHGFAMEIPMPRIENPYRA